MQRSLIFLFILCTNLEAVPSALFWTNCSTEILETGKARIEEDVYFTVFNEQDLGSSLPPDTSLQIGIYSWRNWSAEAGIDYLGGTNDPFFFNAKIGIKEEKLFQGAPSFALELFNVGTRKVDPFRTDQNVVNIIIGKTLPDPIGGTLYASGYRGNQALGRDQAGFMVGYSRSFCPAKYCDDTDYFKWQLVADYASGKNALGGGGVGITYYFTPGISLLTGPIWFNDALFNGSWKWSVQICIEFPFFKPK